MAITRDDINDFFCDLIASPGQNILSNNGFDLLADWSEQQDWWQDFSKVHVWGLIGVTRIWEILICLH